MRRFIPCCRAGAELPRAVLPLRVVLPGAALLLGALLPACPAFAVQWAYAMQTGHGNHSIQVDVDSITQKPGYLAARLQYSYFYDSGGSAPPGGPSSALVDAAFDCTGKRFQVLSRTEYAGPDGTGAAGRTQKNALSAQRWKPASSDYETSALVDWVCSVAAHKGENEHTG